MFQEVRVVLEGLEEQAREGDRDKLVLFQRGAQTLTTKWSARRQLRGTQRLQQVKGQADIARSDLGELGEGRQLVSMPPVFQYCEVALLVKQGRQS